MEAQCEPGTSVSTIRGLHRLNGDTNFVHNLTLSLSSVDTETIDPSGSHPPSRPSSPHSALPSPSSPSGDSVSSFPSVSSSFLFSSGPTSPPHLPQFQFGTHADADSDVDLHDSTAGLIIPSLALPSPARRPTPYGQTLGDLRILILAPSRSARSTAALVAHLLEENEDIAELGTWEEEPRGDDAVGRVAVLRASTDWVEHRDAHGLERVEPARNVEIVELLGYDLVDNVRCVRFNSSPSSLTNDQACMSCRRMTFSLGHSLSYTRPSTRSLRRSIRNTPRVRCLRTSCPPRVRHCILRSFCF